MKFIKYVLLFLTVFMPFDVCAKQAAEPLKIGVYLPLTGEYAAYGQIELDGIQLAHEKMPVVLGRPVELVIMDNKSDKMETVKAVHSLIEQSKVLAIIGTHDSSLAMVGADVAEKAHIPMIGTSCTDPLVTQDKSYAFRACFVDSYQASAIASYAYNTLGYKSAAIFMNMSEHYSVGLAAAFKRAYTVLGGEIAQLIKYDVEDKDFSKQISELITYKPDFVFMPSYFTQGIAIIKQARDLGAALPFIGADAMDNPEIIRLGGAAIEGFLHTTFPYDVNVPPKYAESKEFTAAWRREYPNKEPNAFAVLGYNAYLMLMDAITRAAEADPEAVAKALASIEDLPSPLGLISVDESHNVEMPVGIIEYKGGNRAYIGEIQPER